MNNRRAFTLVELLVVIAIIAILAAMFIPSFKRAKASAKSAVCKNNLRQLGVGLSLYVSEFSYYPLEATETNREVWAAWRETLLPYFGENRKLLVCPFGPYYGYNARGSDQVTTDNKGKTTGWGTLGLGFLRDLDTPVPESRVVAPTDMIAFGDGCGWYSSDHITAFGFGWPGCSFGGYHQDRRYNAMFCDGHLESGNSERQKRKHAQDEFWDFKPDEAQTKRWNNDNQPHPETWPKPGSP